MLQDQTYYLQNRSSEPGHAYSALHDLGDTMKLGKETAAGRVGEHLSISNDLSGSLQFDGPPYESGPRPATVIIYHGGGSEVCTDLTEQVATWTII